jgi:hypothetical protein
MGENDLFASYKDLLIFLAQRVVTLSWDIDQEFFNQLLISFIQPCNSLHQASMLDIPSLHCRASLLSSLSRASLLLTTNFHLTTFSSEWKEMLLIGTSGTPYGIFFFPTDFFSKAPMWTTLSYTS